MLRIQNTNFSFILYCFWCVFPMPYHKAGHAKHLSRVNRFYGPKYSLVFRNKIIQKHRNIIKWNKLLDSLCKLKLWLKRKVMRHAYVLIFWAGFCAMNVNVFIFFCIQWSLKFSIIRTNHFCLLLCVCVYLCNYTLKFYMIVLWYIYRI